MKFGKGTLAASFCALIFIAMAVAVAATPNKTAATKGSSAMAAIKPSSGSTVSGSAIFKEKNGGVEVTIEVKGAKPGLHGVHLHENGDCSAADAKSAGGHFNPDHTNHGAPTADPHHAGDLGNITIGANGAGKLKIFVKGLTVAAGDHSVVGRAVIVHADPDDLKSQPAGNAGARFGCGVVTSM